MHATTPVHLALCLLLAGALACPSAESARDAEGDDTALSDTSDARDDITDETPDAAETDAEADADADAVADSELDPSADASDTASDTPTDGSADDVDADEADAARDASSDSASDSGDTGTQDAVHEDIATDARDDDADAADAVTDTGPVPDAEPDAEPDTPPLPAFPDVTVGPYPSALTLFVNSARSLSSSYDSSVTYTHVAAQGYVLQSIGHVLWAARGLELDAREELITIALSEIAELRAADDRVLSGGPAFGLPDAWDAFGDGSTNPAFTAYTWQSGMAAYGVALIARILADVDHPAAAEVLGYGVELVDYWEPFYSTASGGGFFWYSDRSSDAIAVHNTSALVAMAAQTLAESGGPARLGARPSECAALLWARMSGNPTIGYRWNYADDGIDPGSRRAEDVSHALVTLQLMRFAGDRGWWSRSQMRGVASTLRDVIWTGNAARLHGRVDGSSGGDSEWTWTRAAAIGYAAHSDAGGGDPLVFDLARSLLFSTDLARNDRAFDGRVGATGILTLAMLLSRRPAAYSADTEWLRVAGPGDDGAPEADGSVRFYTVEWAAPASATRGSTTLVARRATATTANLLVDLPTGYAGRVAVSLTYSSAGAGNVQQWDGSRYHTLAPLAATTDNEGTLRWHRTTFELATTHRFDYQGGAGTNILLQLTGATPTIHRIEATRLD